MKSRLSISSSILLSIVACSPTHDPSTDANQPTQIEATARSHHPDPGQIGWELVWQDEFNGSALDEKKWSRTLDCGGGGNHELQCYTDRPDNSFIKAGILHLAAKEESFSGPKLPENDSRYQREDTSKTLPFTSARLHSKTKFDFKYGRVDVRAKVADGKGMWSAIWMLPSESVYGRWPASGEIDIMEALNPGLGPDEVHGTLHYGLSWPQWENKVQAYHLDHNPAEQFHTYAIEWESDQIRWYVDGQHYQTQTASGWYNYTWQGQDKGFQADNPRAPFDQAFYLILNLAIGGNWPGDPDRNWLNDREMLIDYVRVYQCKPLESSSTTDSIDAENADDTGKGCATVDDQVEINTDIGKPGINQYLLYGEGPETLLFKTETGSISNQLATTSFGHVRQQTADGDGQRSKVWDIQFSGDGAIKLSSADMSDAPGYESALSLLGGAGWSQHGDLTFDLLVKERTDESELSLAMSSGNGKRSQVALELPAPGLWQRVAVSIAQLANNPGKDAGGVDLDHVRDLMQLNYQGTGLAIQIDNIMLQCAYNTEPETWQIQQTCGLMQKEKPPEPIYLKVNDVDWQLWDCCGGAKFSEVKTESGRQNVVEYRFDTTPTTPGLITGSPLDLSQYVSGFLELDFRQVAPPPAGSQWYIKLEGTTTAAQVLLTEGGPAPTEDWQHYVFGLKDQLDGVDMSTIQRVLIFPDWGKADGAVMRVDELRFVAPGSAKE